jgi:hypothetical protein
MSGSSLAAGEDRQHARPVRTAAGQAPDAHEPLMSWSAYDLKVRAAAHGAAGGQPGFVPDGYLEDLDDLGLQATITADELRAAGLWERTAGGYRIPDQARQHPGQDPPAPEPAPAATAWARRAEPVVITPPCAACGAPAARVELVAPGQLPAQWHQWPPAAQASISRQRQPGQWHLLVTGPAAGNGYGDPIDTARAGQIAWAFRPPLRFAQVHEAGLHDDAGFCPGCDAPYCHRHWHLSPTGYGSCPRGHGKSLDPAGAATARPDTE